MIITPKWNYELNFKIKLEYSNLAKVKTLYMVQKLHYL